MSEAHLNQLTRDFHKVSSFLLTVFYAIKQDTRAFMSIFQVSPPSFPAIWILCSANKGNSFLCLFFAWSREDDYGSQISGASLFEILEFSMNPSKTQKRRFEEGIKRETKSGWKMREKNEWWRKVINREQNSRMS